MLFVLRPDCEVAFVNTVFPEPGTHPRGYQE
jgi:hypothetical protein